MATVRAFYRDDLAGVSEVEPGTVPPALAEAGFGQQLEQQGNSWTVLAGDTILMCAGTLLIWPGRHQAWAFVTEAAAGHALQVTRIGRWILDRAPGRVEATVRRDFDKGQRWVKALGFQVENPPGVLRQYGFEGEDHIAFVRFVG